jgi:hypothetical protein
MAIPTDNTGAIIGDGHSEHQHQAAFFMWLRESSRLQTDEALRDALKWAHSIPNAAAGRKGFKTRSGHVLPPLQAVKMKAEGLTKGVLDIRVDYVQRKYRIGGAINFDRKSGLVGEFKKPKEKMTDAQTEYAEFARTQNLHVCLWFSWQQAAVDVVNYMQLDRFAPILLGNRTVRTFAELSAITPTAH